MGAKLACAAEPAPRLHRSASFLPHREAGDCHLEPVDGERVHLFGRETSIGKVRDVVAKTGQVDGTIGAAHIGEVRAKQWVLLLLTRAEVEHGANRSGDRRDSPPRSDRRPRPRRFVAAARAIDGCGAEDRGNRGSTPSRYRGARLRCREREPHRTPPERWRPHSRRIIVMREKSMAGVSPGEMRSSTLETPHAS